MAQRAKDGKVSVSRLSRWIGKMKMSGAVALMWKEMLLQLRAGPLVYLLFGGVMFVMVLMPAMILGRSGEPHSVEAAGIGCCS